MKKLFTLLIPLMLAGCSNSVDVIKKGDYKCGTEIVSATFLDDDSMILRMKGTDYVLNRNEAASGAKYMNVGSAIIFWNKGSDNYLEVGGLGYPDCVEIVR